VLLQFVIAAFVQICVLIVEVFESISIRFHISPAVIVDNLLLLGSCGLWFALLDEGRRLHFVLFLVAKHALFRLEVLLLPFLLIVAEIEQLVSIEFVAVVLR